MITQKTIKGLSFFSRTYSLEDAQRMNTSKPTGKSRDNHPLSDEFIRPMWVSPDERRKLMEQG